MFVLTVFYAVPIKLALGLGCTISLLGAIGW